MTNCCDTQKNCDQGRDCILRKQRIKEIDDAYIKGHDPDPYHETLDTFKELITVIIVVASIGVLSYFVWGKL
jgi:hypothetical protein